MKHVGRLMFLGLIASLILMTLERVSFANEEWQPFFDAEAKIKKVEYTNFLSVFFKSYVQDDVSSMKSIIASHSGIIRDIITDYSDLAEVMAGHHKLMLHRFEWSYGKALDFSRLAHMLLTIYFFSDRKMEMMDYVNTRFMNIIVQAMHAADKSLKSKDYTVAIDKYEGIASLARSFEITAIEQVAYNALSDIHEQLGLSLIHI